MNVPMPMEGRFDLPPLIRANAVYDIFYGLKSQTKCLSVMRNLAQISHTSPEPGGMFCTGESGFGKTTLIRNLEREMPRRSENGQLIVPVLSVAFDRSTESDDLTLKLLTNLQVNLAMVYALRPNDKLAVLCEALAACLVQLIVIDEFHLICETRGRRVANNITHDIKRIHDISKISIACFGLEEGRRALSWNKEFRTRISCDVTLRALEMGSEFEALLTHFDSNLPMHEPCGLAQLAEKIFLATDGNLRSMRKLFFNAVAIAAHGKATSLALSHFRMAHVQAFGEKPNPFK